MAYQLILDPSLAVSPHRFVDGWNEEPRCKTVAVAQVATDAAKGYDPALAEVINLVVIPLAVGIATNALYDLIKGLLLKQGVRRQTRIILQKQPDGTELLIVTIDEES